MRVQVVVLLESVVTLEIPEERREDILCGNYTDDLQEFEDQFGVCLDSDTLIDGIGSGEISDVFLVNNNARL